MQLLKKTLKIWTLIPYNKYKGDEKRKGCKMFTKKKKEMYLANVTVCKEVIRRVHNVIRLVNPLTTTI